MKSPRPTPPQQEEALKALLQTHGLQQPAAPFAAALTQLIVTQYARPVVEAYPAGAWLGKAILGGLAGALAVLLVLFIPPSVRWSVTGLAVGALGGGLCALFWLLKYQGESLPNNYSPERLSTR
jgi:hypothetical protein